VPEHVRPTEWTVTHDFAFVFGGAEWVTHVLASELLPGSRTAVLAGTPEVAARLNDFGPVEQLMPAWINQRTYRLATPLYPHLLASRQPVEGNVVASSYAFAHHVRATGRMIVYCHSPLRQAWTGASAYAAEGPLIERVGARSLGRVIRGADRVAAARADGYVATSRAVQSRLARCYGLHDVPIVPPPVNDRTYHRTPRHREDFYLFAGRITEPYKRLGLLLEAFAQMSGRQLMVVGDGRDRERLQRAAPSNVRFLGWQPATEVAALYNRARALIFPSEDDFGLVPVEAMACGLPVLAYARGGALDTVVPAITGLFFDEQTPAAVTKAITQFEQRNWDEDAIVARARRYGLDSFVTKMRQVLEGRDE
jgi:glycosyltransferase involved in cell wall biosynthesis